jgi:Asp/Glu/hydantoin racemase
MARISGGYAVYGQEMGIIMLDCPFPRPPGDIGNARSFPFPVRYEVLEGVAAAGLTKHEDPAAVAALIAAAQRLERAGARIILTSCGLFLRYQKRLAAAVGVPVATSAVLLLPFLSGLLPPKRKVGVLTADAISLTPALAGTGWDDSGRLALQGMEDRPVFRRTILDPAPPYELDMAALQDEVVQTVEEFLKREPSLGAILVECTNLSPYSDALRNAFGLPVFDVIDLARLLQGAVSGQAFASRSGIAPW